MDKAAPLAGDGSTQSLVRVAQAWERFWFTPADPTTLGLIRICAGLVVLYVHLAYTFDLQALLGKDAWFSLELMDEWRHDTPYLLPAQDWNDQQDTQRYLALGNTLPSDPHEAAKVQEYRQRWAVDPRQVYARGNWVWSVWFHVTDPAAMAAIHTFILVSMLLFTLGLCTRMTSVLTWVGALSYIQRTPTSLFGLDTMLVVVLLYLMIGPSGATLSLDRLITRYWAARRALRRHRPVPALRPPAPRISANLALRLMQVHFCFIYMAAGLSKLQGNTWWNGTAIWSTLVNPEFSPLRFQIYMDLQRWLAGHRRLWEVCMVGGVAYTLTLEISFPFLVWVRRTRWVMISGAVLLHTGIALCMGLVMFSLTMLALVLAFVPGGEVRRLLARVEVRFARWWSSLLPKGRSQHGAQPQAVQGCAPGP
jgi:hypothetical protein